MDQIFQIGELVIMQKATYFEEHNDAPGIVLEALKRHRSLNMLTMKRESIQGYRIRILVENAPVVTAHPYQLRKLRDDERGLTSSKLSKPNTNGALTGNRKFCLPEDQSNANIPSDTLANHLDDNI